MSKRGNGEGTIYWREDRQRWCTQLHLGTKADGKPNRPTIYGKTQAEVLAKKKEIEASSLLGKPVERQDLTIERLMEKYLNEEVRPRLSPKTVRSYEQLTRLNIVPHLGRIRTSALDASTVTRWQSRLQSQGLSGQSIKLSRDCLSRAIDMAMRFDYIARNVVNLAKAPAVKHKPVPQIGRSEAQEILAIFSGHRFEAIMCLMIGCGLRIGEVLGLCWSDIEGGRILVAHQLSRTQGNTGQPYSRQYRGLHSQCPQDLQGVP